MPLVFVIILVSARIISVPFSLSTWITILQEGGIKHFSTGWKSHVQQFKPYKISPVLHLCLFFTPIGEHLRALESNILAEGSDPLEYRSRQMAQCSMTGVAAALVAQVANSTLQLQYMPTIHWIVPALCTTTIIIALLSVYNSFALHNILIGFARADDLRAAFTYQNPAGTQGEGEEEESERRFPCYLAAMKLWGSHYLLELAILLYIVTIWVYLGIAWGVDLQGSGVRSRNVFIFSLLASLIMSSNFGGGVGLGRALSRSPL